MPQGFGSSSLPPRAGVRGRGQVIESMHEKTDEAMCKLLQALFMSFVITIEQMRAGFQRVYDQMVDISIDVPQAYSVLERWVLRCRQVTSFHDFL